MTKSDKLPGIKPHKESHTYSDISQNHIFYLNCTDAKCPPDTRNNTNTHTKNKTCLPLLLWSGH